MTRSRLLLACLAVCATFLALASTALGASPAAHLELHTFATPTSFSAADNQPCEESIGPLLYQTACDEYQVTVSNAGAAATSGATITLSDTLPTGLSAVGFQALRELPSKESIELNSDCKIEASVTVRCKFPLRLGPEESLELLIAVEVHGGAVSGALNTASVSGGGTPSAEVSEPDLLDSPPAFGLSSLQASPFGVAGEIDTTAGDHPFTYTTRLDFNNVIRRTASNTLQSTAVRDLRDVIVDLPPGLVGAATATPYCTLAQLSSKVGCPPDTRVGQIRSEPFSNASVNGGIFNIAPERGVPAEFGFDDNLDNVHIVYASVVPTPGGYVTRAITRETPQIPLVDAIVQFFGNPAAMNKGPEAPAMFTNGANCDGQPQVTNVYFDAWQAPGSYNADGTPNLADPNWLKASTETPPLTGCEELAFEPTIEAKPESTRADAPTGFDVNIKLPQPESFETLATPPLRDAVVTLPEGMNVNPSSANGLEGCSLAQVGMSAAGVPDASAPSCPDASKIGTVELESPALPSEVCKPAPSINKFRNLAECEGETEKVPLKGSIYVARQQENPFGSLLAIYIVVDDSRTGVIVKLAGEVKADESTGRLTTVVRNSPQFPFSELRTHFFGGATASLRTPSVCGRYSVTSQLTPWSAPESGPPATPQGPFEVASGATGGACPRSPGEEPNSPSFEAASENPAAGVFSPVLVRLGREDGSQNFGQIVVTLPPGASGRIAGIPRCSDGQIAQAQARSNLGEGALELASPSCPQDAKIGTVTVGAGAGPEPFYVTGKAYLAGPYEGAPFSAVFITPAKAGPFDLGVVVVRAALLIDPTTAQVTTRADPLPQILHGIPLDIRSVAVNVSRPGFTITPTNCSPLSVNGQEVSTLGQSAPLQSRYQVGGCERLPFAPKLSASVVGKASKANGTSFAVNIDSAGLGQANIAKVALQLPKTLPSRLKTLQKACLAAVFEANPASCAETSVIGNATVNTPLLASPLSGPAYLVSHGNAAFPDVEFVLQGEGVTLVLDGKTDIKAGITYSRFESAPDAPFTTFKTTLPAGPHGILTTNLPESRKYNLCGSSLAMPTTIVSQSGVTIKQNTKIAISGCPKSKALTRKQKLAKALKACHKKHSKNKRQACERQARKRYGAKKKPKKAAKKRH